MREECTAYHIWEGGEREGHRGREKVNERKRMKGKDTETDK